MARPKTPEGKRVTICIKVSEEQAVLIDVARGIRARSEWGRDALLAAAERQRPPAGRFSVVDRLADAVRQNRAAANGPCPHPKARVNKGLCGACGTNVGTTKAGQQ